jgi:signal transduction histidine kinase
MGLYLVKTQVVAMGGKIEVESKINQGTTFRIYLRKRPPENLILHTA